MRSPRLILHPTNLNYIPDQLRQLIDGLREAGFINGHLENGGPEAYQAGDEFLSFVCFLGCSPAVTLEHGQERSTEEREIVHIRIPPPREHPEFIAGPFTEPPVCPVCEMLDEAWQEQLQPGPQVGDIALWHCPHCHHECPIDRLDWRRGAGLVRFTIEIWGVYPAEALPDEQLIRLLRKLTGEDWSYFYSRDSSLNTM